MTDTSGETQFATQSVRVGYTALCAGVSTDEWQVDTQEVKLKVDTTSLDGDGRPAKGTLKIYKLRQPEKVMRSDLRDERLGDNSHVRESEAKLDRSRPIGWGNGEAVFTADFATDGGGKTTIPAKLHAGFYRVVLDTADVFKKPVRTQTQFQVLNLAANHLSIKVPNIVAAEKWTVEPGEVFTLFWGTGYDSGRAFIEVEHRGKITHAFWTEAGKTQQVLKVPVTEAMRGGFSVRVTQVRENRAYITNRLVEVPWTNKKLTVKWEHFVSKLEPGQKETFTAVISGPDAKKASAEMVAALYDQSLDSYLPHHWKTWFRFPRDSTSHGSSFDNCGREFGTKVGFWKRDYAFTGTSYRLFPDDITEGVFRRSIAIGGLPGPEQAEARGG